MPLDDTQRVLAVISQQLATALTETFRIQASTSIDQKKLEGTKPGPLKDIEVLSTIGMKSSSYQGLVGIYFPARTFLGVINKMLGENHSVITDENADAAGELMNILYASARVKINQGGHDFLPAIPTVVRGTQVGMMHGGVPIIIRATCECEFGPIYMEVSLKGC